MGVASELDGLVRVFLTDFGELDGVAVVAFGSFGLRFVEMLESKPIFVGSVELGAELVRLFELGGGSVCVDCVDGVPASSEAERGDERERGSAHPTHAERL